MIFSCPWWSLTFLPFLHRAVWVPEWITVSRQRLWSLVCSASFPPSTWQPQSAQTSGMNIEVRFKKIPVTWPKASGPTLLVMTPMKSCTVMYFFDTMAQWDCGDGVSVYPKTYFGITKKGQVFLVLTSVSFACSDRNEVIWWWPSYV